MRNGLEDQMASASSPQGRIPSRTNPVTLDIRVFKMDFSEEVFKMDFSEEELIQS